MITGAAGFIGSALILRLLENEKTIIGVDNLNNYYDVRLKKSRLKLITEKSKKLKANWIFHEFHIEDKKSLDFITEKYSPSIVIHLAAQAGVRYSLDNPKSYADSNLIGFFNILEFCKENKVKNFVFASSSSVYGLNKKIPFVEDDNVDHPISFYAATKKSNELMAHSYSHLYDIPTTGLRFFTVYGPFGRPDMAPMIFANAILNSKPINIFNYGNLHRDFTYIDDIVNGLFGCCYKPAIKSENFSSNYQNKSYSNAPFQIFNIGNSNPIKIDYFISMLELNFNKKAIINLMPLQPGDVKFTYADISKIQKWIGYKPKVSFEKGIREFSKWYLDFYE